jgi:hypothetical protein
MSSNIRKQRVFFTMIDHPCGTPMRVGKAYTDRKAARSWLSFVSAAWRGLLAFVEACDLRYVDGVLDAASLKLLDERYNLDAPDKP